MNVRIIATTVILCACRIALAQRSTSGDFQTFELTPSPATTDYWLLTDPRQQLPGNAAPLYADAGATLNDAVNKQTAEALDAYWSGKDTFESKAAAVEKAKVYFTVDGTFDLLDIAARREYYQWDSSYRQQGANTLLPHLLAERKLLDLISVRALRQIRGGQLDDAVATIRMGYELGRKVGTEPLLICGLVGQAIVTRSTWATAELMKQRQSPNLYWALAGLPRPMVRIQTSISGELCDFQATFPKLNTSSVQDLSAETWHGIFDQVVALLTKYQDGPASAEGWANQQTVADEVTRMAPQARDYYAKRFNLSADQVESLDAFKVVATYWYGQNEDLLAQAYAMAALPYPMLLSRTKEFDRQAKQITLDEPANPFLAWVSSTAKATDTFARGDRTLAALTDVEAIRSYAAANGGKLPAHLEDVTDTPAFDDPYTGKPFDYEVKGDVATLSDPHPAEYPLKYVIRIGQ